MNKKTIASIVTSTLVTTLAVVGVTFAATPASNDTSLLNKGTVEVDSLKVGKDGVGGVTFFNGTIINATTTNGVGNPVAFGDDVRIDGRVFRGATAGPGKAAPGEAAQPFIINDDAQVAGSLEVGGTDVFAAIAAKGDKTAVDANTAAVAGKVSKSAPSWNATEGVASVSRHAFVPYIDNPSNVGTQEYGIGPGYGVGGLAQLTSLGVSEDQFYAPLSLPNGAVVTSLACFVTDTDGSNNLDVSLERVTSGTDTATAMGGFTTSGSATSMQKITDTSISSSTVDNNTYSYRVKADFNTATGSLVMGDCAVKYTTTNPS